MLLGRFNRTVGGSPVTASPGAGTLTVSSYAPDVVVSLTVLSNNHFDGADASTSLSDVFSVTWTAAGTELDTAIKKYGASSLRCPAGSNTDAHSGSIPSFDSTADFTIEGWVLYTIADGGSAFWLGDSGGANFTSRLIMNGASSQMTVDDASGSSFTLAQDTWYHYAIVHDSNAATLTGYIEGTQRAQKTSFSPGTWDTMYLKHTFFSTEEIHFDEFRLVDGAIYSGSFTPPTGPF